MMVREQIAAMAETVKGTVAMSEVTELIAATSVMVTAKGTVLTNETKVPAVKAVIAETGVTVKGTVEMSEVTETIVAMAEIVKGTVAMNEIATVMAKEAPVKAVTVRKETGGIRKIAVRTVGGSKEGWNLRGQMRFWFLQGRLLPWWLDGEQLRLSRFRWSCSKRWRLQMTLKCLPIRSTLANFRSCLKLRRHV